MRLLGGRTESVFIPIGQSWTQNGACRSPGSESTRDDGMGRSPYFGMNRHHGHRSVRRKRRVDVSEWEYEVRHDLVLECSLTAPTKAIGHPSGTSMPSLS